MVMYKAGELLKQKVAGFSAPDGKESDYFFIAIRGDNPSSSSSLLSFRQDFRLYTTDCPTCPMCA